MWYGRMIDRIQVAVLLLSKKVVYGSAIMLGLLALTIDPMVFSAAATIVIAAIAAAAVTIINALGSVKKELMAKQAELLSQGAVIAGHVDGMNTAAVAKRTADEDTISGLRRQLADSEKRAALLAQSKVRP
jgi:hypothetical protein